MLIKNARLSRKLMILIGAFITGFMVYGFYSYHTLKTVKVHGPIYESIIQGKDLTADVLPPPEYIVETYMTCLHMGSESEESEIQALDNRIRELKDEYITRHEHWNKTLSDGPLKNALVDDSYKPVMEFYETYEHRFLPAIMAGDNEAAASLLHGEMDRAFIEHRQAIERVVQLANEKNQAYEKEAVAIVNARTASMVGLIVLTLAVTSILGMMIASAITRPITMLSSAARKLADGDVSMDITADSKDETGELASAFGSVIKNIKSLLNETSTLNQQMMMGKLRVRGNADLFKGSYKDLLLGFNRTLDTFVDNLDTIPSPIQFVDTDFKLQFMNKTGASMMGSTPEQLEGIKCSDLWKTTKCSTRECPCAVAMDEGCVHTCENDCMIGGADKNIFCASAPLKDDSGRIIGSFEFVTDQTEVKQATRKAEEAARQAEQAQIVAQKVSQYQTEEAWKLTENLGKLADGDLAFNISVGEGDADTKEAREIFARIADAVSKCAESIKTMSTDAVSLAQAAIEGNLGVRADASVHQGEYRKIVEGMNNTFDAVVSSMTETLNVLERVANRDLTARVIGDYKGDYQKIKDAVNTAVDNLDSGFAQVSVGAEAVASASGQISAGSQSLAQGASEQASSLEEVASSLAEMLSMTKQNTSNAKEARSMADETMTSADRGVDSMRRLSEAIERIKASSDETAKIVKTIDEIAFQTNLLALNAAVEAARAGDAGKGFAVVAEEVRSLAMRSAEAAKNTSSMIEGAVRNAEDGVSLNQEVLRNLEDINDAARRVSEVMAEIAAASEQQSQGIDQINVAVTQMDSLTQQNAANSEESASAAEELSSQAEEMKGLVRSFRLSKADTGRSDYRLAA